MGVVVTADACCGLMSDGLSPPSLPCLPSLSPSLPPSHTRSSSLVDSRSRSLALSPSRSLSLSLSPSLFLHDTLFLFISLIQRERDTDRQIFSVICKGVQQEVTCTGACPTPSWLLYVYALLGVGFTCGRLRRARRGGRAGGARGRHLPDGVCVHLQHRRAGAAGTLESTLECALGCLLAAGKEG
jgi:hypothetical protein